MSSNKPRINQSRFGLRSCKIPICLGRHFQRVRYQKLISENGVTLDTQRTRPKSFFGIMLKRSFQVRIQLKLLWLPNFLAFAVTSAKWLQDHIRYKMHETIYVHRCFVARIPNAVYCKKIDLAFTRLITTRHHGSDENDVRCQLLSLLELELK
jgi:hypothetical protein